MTANAPADPGGTIWGGSPTGYPPRMTKSPTFLFALLLLVAPSCGGSDNDCYWERRCESIGGQLTCVWVKLCPGDAGYGVPGDATYPIEAPPESDTWDVRIGTTDTSAQGPSPLVAHLLGDDVMERVGADAYRRWWFHGWPAAEIERAVHALTSPDVEWIRPHGAPDAGDVGCRGRVHRDALPSLPRALRPHETLHVTAPPASTLVPTGAFLGMAVYVTPEEGTGARTWLLGEGESIDVEPEAPGRWRVRLVLITEGLCELGVRDAILLTEQDVDVARVSER